MGLKAQFPLMPRTEILQRTLNLVLFLARYIVLTRMKSDKPLFVLLLASWLLSSPLCAVACSVVMGYVRPTNYELVKEADAIVLANAISFEKKGETRRGKSYGVFKFKILDRFKGDFKDEFISVEGDNDLRPWGDPNDFSFTKGDHGPCNPTDYELKGNYVLFLGNWKGVWSVSGAPFTRVNVSVEGTNAPWTKAVRQYARIAKLGDYEKEKAALLELRSCAQANDADCPKALIQDIDAHFSKPTPAKSFSDLQALYEQTKDPEIREYVLWACTRGEKSEAKEFFRTLLRSGVWLQFLNPVCSYVAQVKLSGFTHVFAATLSTNRVEHDRQMLLFALSGSAEASEQPLMQKVLQSINEEEAVILGDWFVKHPSQEAIKQFTKLASKDYSENHELTLALAGMGDTNVLNWAKEFIKRPAENHWLAYYVFALSPLPAADALARQTIQRGDSDGLVSLVQGYKDSKRADRLDRIKEAIALKTKSRKLIYWLRRTLGDWAYEGDKQAEALLSQLPVVESEQ
jgi:hypothetical protein